MKVPLFKTPYMVGTLSIVREAGDVAIYPTIETARAACVIPLISDYFGDGTPAWGVALLLQEGRPETDGKPVIKAIGGYCREKSDKQTLRDTAAAKAGIRLPRTLQYLREASSYSVAKIPVQMYICAGYRSIRGASLAPGCSLKTMSLRAAADLAVKGELFDPCTVETILILRSEHPDR